MSQRSSSEINEPGMLGDQPPVTPARSSSLRSSASSKPESNGSNQTPSGSEPADTLAQKTPSIQAPPVAPAKGVSKRVVVPPPPPPPIAPPSLPTFTARDFPATKPVARPETQSVDNPFDFGSLASLNQFDPSSPAAPSAKSSGKRVSEPGVLAKPVDSPLAYSADSLDTNQAQGPLPSPGDLIAKFKSLWPSTMHEMPSWMVSLVVHVGVILLLALIPLSGQIQTTVSLIVGMGEGGGEELSEFEIETDSMELTESADPVETVASPTMENLVSEELMPKLSTEELVGKVSLRNGLKGRTGPMKGSLLKAYGGTAETEDAVNAGLRWLAKIQKSDGSWSLVGPYTDGGITENKPAATAMSLLAFMGAGNTHRDGEHYDRVNRGITFLLSLQNRDGFFADQAAGNQRTYAHAQATIAVCELYGMTGDEKLRDAAQKAVRYCERAQSKTGGWRYQPGEGGDTSVTGWYVMALISARMAGLDVDSEVLERVHQFLDTVQRKGRTNQVDRDGERYAYQAYSTPTPAMTAEGMLCRLYLGWDTKDPRILSGAELLVSNPMSTDDGRISYYYWYYATTTLHHMGGSAWSEWNQSMKEVLPRLQVKGGKENGSWPVDEDNHSSAGGRLYATCFALYCLESYYRHLPLSEMAPK